MIPRAILLGLAVAHAQSPSGEPTAEDGVELHVDAPDEAADTDDEDLEIYVDRRDPEVVIVEGDRVRAAREAVIREGKRAGYVREIRKEGRTILRHDDAWKGDIVLYDDGRVSVKRQPVRFEPPTGKKRPQDYLWCVLVPLCIKPSGQTVAPRIFRAREREALAAVADEVQTWRERISDRAIDGKVDALPDKLARLWSQGVPLEDGPRLETHEARRAAIFDYWNSRTETEWGERMRDTVEGFVRGVVQSGDHPFTPEEVEALNARRTVLRPFLPPRRAP